MEPTTEITVVEKFFATKKAQGRLLSLFKGLCCRNCARLTKVRLFIEILWPLILFLVLMWVRTRGLKENRQSCHLIEKALPSVGGFEFLQNYFCTLNNTCYDDYVENQGNEVWKNSLLVFSNAIKTIIPELQSVVKSKTGLQTVKRLVKDVTSVIDILASFQKKSENVLLGRIKLKQLLGKYGLKAFLQATSVYTNLQENVTLSLLDTDIFLDQLNRFSVLEVVQKLNSGDCKLIGSSTLLRFSNQSIVEQFCELDILDKNFIGLFFFTFLDRKGMISRLQGLHVFDSDEERVKLKDYDLSTLQSLRQIAKELGSIASEYASLSELNATEATTVFLYKGFCGDVPSTTNGTFIFDPGSANRYDSLRDQLKDWNNDHHYEIDTDISPACNNLFMNLESIPLTSLIWRQLKPFIRGVIFYSPKDSIADAIMEKVDKKFSKLHNMDEGIRAFANVLHRVKDWTKKNSESINLTLQAMSERENFDFAVKLFQINLSKQSADTVFTTIKEAYKIDMDLFLSKFDFYTELFQEILSCVRYDKSHGFETEWEAVNAGSKLLSIDKLWAVVVFENVSRNSSSTHLHYKIRMDSDKVDGTRSSRDRLTRKSPRRRPAFDLKYITNGFIYLQEMIEHSIIEILTGEKVETAVFMQQFPYPCYIYDQFIRAISRTFPLFMVLSWVYASSMIIKSVVMEKELRLREVMKVMGLSNGVIWCGWFIDSFIIMSVSATVLTLILKYGKVIEHSDVTLIFVFMISYTVATISFSFFVSTFFSRANSAAAAGGIIFFVSYMPYNMMLIWEEKLSWSQILTSNLISNVAFGFGCTYFARFEEDGIGAQWDRITLRTLPGDDYNLGYCILMLWVDAVLYLLLTWYTEAIFPGGSGVPKKWNFCFRRSYWIKKKSQMRVNDSMYHSVPTNGALDDKERPVVEGEPEENVGVSVFNLGKVYENGKVALENLTLNFYENQITSFLGHNGAGKTTTISILTGLFPPSSGTARIHGLDILKDMDSIRRYTGICPQYNTLFDRLNVEEHLRFYAGLRGKRGSDFETECTKMIHDLGIPHKRHDFPRNLSGGMKRKLSVACSFIGGSKTVFLDEPTSGVDPYSRRSIWELLLKYKQGRTIILTTHFMDEADLLGDRIAIISQGKLKACGSSLFLKSQFGRGYCLRVVRDMSMTEFYPHGTASSGVDSKKLKPSAVNPAEIHGDILKSSIRSVVPSATLVEHIGTEIVFHLPYFAVEHFPLLFQKLEDNVSKLGISSYGISDTTLEEIFLKITMADIENNVESFHALSSRCKRAVMEIMRKFKSRRAIETFHPSVNSANVPSITVVSPGNLGEIPVSTNVASAHHIAELTSVNAHGNLDHSDAEIHNELNCSSYLLEDGSVSEDEFSTNSNVNSERYSQFTVVFVQILTIIVKRLKGSIRNMKSMFFEIILPAVCIAITLLFTLIIPPATDEPPRELTPWTYASPNYIFFADKNKVSMEFEEFGMFVKALLGPTGMGTPCMPDTLVRGICSPSKWSNETAQKFFKEAEVYNPEKIDSCSCNIGSLQCPFDVDKIQPPQLKSITNDYIMDVSKLNVPDWIEKTYRKYEAMRYGGFEMQKRHVIAPDTIKFLEMLDHLTGFNVYIPAEDSPFGFNFGFDDLDMSAQESYIFKVWYENRGWVSSVAYLNAFHNILLREKLPPDLKQVKNEYGITVYNHPMNLTKSQSKKESMKTVGIGVVHAICVIFALSFVPASFTVYLIEERRNGGKHLHLVSGVKPITYWIANFIYDMMKYTVPVLLSLSLFLVFNARAYVGEESILSFVLLLFAYGWAAVPAMYPFSFGFNIPSTAFVVLACMNLFIGVMTTVSTFVLEQFGDKDLEKIGAILKQAFLVFPHYCLGRGLIELVALDIKYIAREKLGFSGSTENRLEWQYLGKMLVFLTIQGFVYFGLNLCLEYRQMCCKIHIRHFLPVTTEEDEDVLKEKSRVLQNTATVFPLRSEKLTKYYKGKKHPAVNGLTFAVNQGECFGLLGINGAGKSTCFKMLSGDVRITSGKALVCGNDVETNLDEARKNFGYCPQEDGLDLLLNAYELLTIYGLLRGMKYKDTKEAVNRLIQMIGLTKCADRSCGTYSGGNKRKLSTAIALIGDPSLVFLDEPTSGMDPASRRKFWKLILRLVKMGKSVVLTSHSMEECEALCSRIAIMVNGQFVCLGSLQHLKNRFGEGYTITVKCRAQCEDFLMQEIKTRLPTARLEDHHCLQMRFSVSQEETKLSDIFNVLLNLREKAAVDDYSVSQTTLDDIFVKFASNQKDDCDR